MKNLNMILLILILLIASAFPALSQINTDGNINYDPASGGLTIQDEGTSLQTTSLLNFTGAGVACVYNGSEKRIDCTIAGGGGLAGFEETGSSPNIDLQPVGDNTGGSIISNIFESSAADISDSGAIRLGNAEQICWESNPTGTDECFTFGADNDFAITDGINISSTIEIFENSIYKSTYDADTGFCFPVTIPVA